MILQELKLSDRQMFREYLLPAAVCRLSAYAFENIYLWRGLYRINWGITQGRLCVFFEDSTGCFLYLPPLSLTGEISMQAAEDVFSVMRERNKGGSGVSRIENIPESMLGGYQGRYELFSAMSEYVCLRRSLVELKGNSFKSKRSDCNAFAKQYRHEYRRFTAQDSEAVLLLNSRWIAERRDNPDKIYRGMLVDSAVCLREALKAASCPESGYRGRLLYAEGRLCGFTLGYALDKETFCVLSEFTDLEVKGAAQFIFREFCSELDGYKYINIMDDSGLDNLRRVKMSYHPEETLNIYSTRNLH
jgi:hypothetical protein